MRCPRWDEEEMADDVMLRPKNRKKILKYSIDKELDKPKKIKRIKLETMLDPTPYD